MGTSGSKQGSFFSSEEMAQNADHWISMLGLVEHPGDEDGYFSVPFEAASRVVEKGFSGERPASSIAYFLQSWAGPPNSETMFFQCRSTEMLFYHAGEPLAIHILEENSALLTTKILGLDIAKGQLFLVEPGSPVRFSPGTKTLPTPSSVVLWLPGLTKETSKP